MTVQDATSKYHAPWPEFAGRHLWVYAGMWRVQNPARKQILFDTENLIGIEGPGCLHCDQPWEPTIGAHCPGPVSE